MAALYLPPCDRAEPPVPQPAPAATPTVSVLPHPPPSSRVYRLPSGRRNLALATHNEQTIGAEITLSGVGLHSGAPAHLRLIPAPAGSGVVFRRTDLENFEIPANGRNVARVSYATSLMRGSVLISTTEHLLSALIGSGVDNVIIEIDNLEVPILDGSALPYVEAFERVGLVRQRRRREYLRILREVEVRDGSKFIGVYPGEGYGIHYSIDFPHPIGSATFTGDLEQGDYTQLIAPARTFGFEEDEPMLRNMGLIRGVSDDCAIIVGGGTVRNGPLRFPDEFVRHKVLDLIGDLALAGRRIQGHVVAERAGHAMHVALVKQLLRDRSAWELSHVAEPGSSTTGTPELVEVSALAYTPQHA